MRTATIGLVVLAGWVLVLNGCGTTATPRNNRVPAAGAKIPLTIEAQIMSDDPGLKYPGLTLITSKADLEKLQSQELINKGIDFDTHTVILLTLGEKRTGGYWGQITGVQVSGMDVFVQAAANAPASNAMTTQAVTHAYAAAVCPRFAARNLHREVASVVGQPQPAGTASYREKNVPFSASPAVTQPAMGQ